MAIPTPFVPVDAVFPDLSASRECLEHLLAQISRTDALLWCGRLNLIVSNPALTDEEQQRFAIETFIPETSDRRRLAEWRAGDATHNDAPVFFRGQVLELARWVALLARDRDDDGATFEDPRERRLFGQAALVAGGMWGQRVFRDVDLVQGAVALPEKRERSLRTLRAAQVENARGPIPIFSLGRGWRIWSHHMPLIWPDVADVFFERTGMSLKEYYLGLAVLLHYYVDIRPENHAAALIAQAALSNADPIQRLLARFLTVESVTVEDFVSAMPAHVADDHLAVIRKHPILSSRHGVAVVLDPVSVSQRAFMAPLFLMLAGEPSSGVNELFRRFGDAFEAYAADLVTSRFASSQASAARVLCNVKLQRAGRHLGELDLVVSEVEEEVCVLELKAVFISDAKSASLDTYNLALREQYGNGRKGMRQLAKAVTLLAEGRVDELPSPLVAARTIRPAIVAADPFLDAPGHAAFLRREFVDALQPDETLGTRLFRKGGLHVAAPIILTIDDFEWLASSLANFS